MSQRRELNGVQLNMTAVSSPRSLTVWMISSKSFSSGAHSSVMGMRWYSTAPRLSDYLRHSTELRAAVRSTRSSSAMLLYSSRSVRRVPLPAEERESYKSAKKRRSNLVNEWSTLGQRKVKNKGRRRADQRHHPQSKCYSAAKRCRGPVSRHPKPNSAGPKVDRNAHWSAVISLSSLAMVADWL